MAKKSAPVTEGSSDARKAAIEKMKAAQAGQDQKPESKDTSKKSKKDSKKSKKDPKPKEIIKDDSGNIMLNRVRVYSPFRVYFDNPAYSVSAVNGTGPFDVLPGHKKFLSLLLPGEVIVRTAKDEEKLKIDRGIMHVRDNTVIVFLDV